MTDMIAAEPHLATRLLARLADPGSAAARLAAVIRETAESAAPVVLTGCGTSEHAAMGAVEILRDGLVRAGLAVTAGTVLAEEAFELSLRPSTTGLVIAVSHESGTAATNRALEAARGAGARTALVTAAATAPAAGAAEIVVATDEVDQSWCHTVGYVSPLLVAAAIAGHLAGEPVDADAAAGLMTASSADEPAAERLAAAIATVDRLLVAGSGADRVAGRELVLKVEEACWLPSAYRDVETLLHGHLAATGDRTGLIVILTDRHARDERTARARQLLAAGQVLGAVSGGILAGSASDAIPADLTPAGRIIVPPVPELPEPVAALLGSALALQLTTERLARARGTNPDAIRRDDARYRAAAEAAER